MTATQSYDPRTALVVVDVQNDFADPAGSLYVDGGEQVVPIVNAEAAAATAAGALVVCTQDWHPPRTPHFTTDGGTWPVHCVADTWGAQLHPDLVAPGERLRKGTGGEDGYSGFTVRDPATDSRSPTALDAVRLGFATTVPADAVRPVELQPGDGARALETMAQAGVRVA